MNFTRIMVMKSGRVHINPESRAYRKPNYKILYSWVSGHLKQIIEGFTELWNEFVETIDITMEKKKKVSKKPKRA